VSNGSTRKGRLNVDLIRQVASTRWLEILRNVAGIPAESLDGKHHPCPKCGGKDRFRLIDEAAGALLCNACFSTKNGDGFAAIQWMKGVQFLEAARSVADYLGLDATGSGAVTKKKPRRTNTWSSSPGTTPWWPCGPATSRRSPRKPSRPPAATWLATAASTQS